MFAASAKIKQNKLRLKMTKSTNWEPAVYSGKEEKKYVQIQTRSSKLDTVQQSDHRGRNLTPQDSQKKDCGRQKLQ